MNKKNYIMRIGNTLSSIQSYFILCLMYFILFGINEDVLTHLGIITYRVVFYSAPIIIIGTLMFYVITKNIKYKRNLLYIVLSFAATVFVFEFFLIK